MSRTKFGASLVLGGWCLLLSLTPPASGQTYSIDWFTIGGGGGTSVGAGFSLTGTIDQPDARRLTGGNYTLEAGFWGVIQTPGAPLLRIRLATGGDAVISWPAPSTGFVLQETLSLASPSWTDMEAPVVVTGGENTVTISAGTRFRFYRLRHP